MKENEIYIWFIFCIQTDSDLYSMRLAGYHQTNRVPQSSYNALGFVVI